MIVLRCVERFILSFLIILLIFDTNEYNTFGVSLYFLRLYGHAISSLRHQQISCESQTPFISIVG